MFQIETDVPVPPKSARRGSTEKYPFAKMEIGQSFFVPGEVKMNSTIASAQKRTGHKFEAFPDQDGTGEDGKPCKGVRVWRVEGEYVHKPRAPKETAAPAAAPASPPA